MLSFLYGLHLIICFIIIAMVLLQVSQQGMGSLFGGGAQTVFGSSAMSTLGKITAGAAVIFFVTSLLISFVIERDRSLIKSTAGRYGAPPPAETPAAPDATPTPIESAPGGVPAPQEEAPGAAAGQPAEQ